MVHWPCGHGVHETGDGDVVSISGGSGIQLVVRLVVQLVVPLLLVLMTFVLVSEVTCFEVDEEKATEVTDDVEEKQRKPERRQNFLLRNVTCYLM